VSDFTKPTTSSTYTNLVSELKDRDDDLAKMLDVTTPTGLPTDAIRWASANSRFEKWNGTAWNALDTEYAINVTTFDGQASSYYRNAANLNAGILPGARFDNTSHGNRTANGSLHAAATTSVAGFMSSTDKTKLDGIETGAEVNPTAAELLTSIKTVDGPADTIMARNANGDSALRYIVCTRVSTSDTQATRTADTIFYSSTDNYIRKNTASGMRTALSVYSKAEIDAMGSSPETWSSLDSTEASTTQTTAGVAGEIASVTVGSSPTASNALLMCTIKFSATSNSQQLYFRFFKNGTAAGGEWETQIYRAGPTYDNNTTITAYASLSGSDVFSVRMWSSGGTTMTCKRLDGRLHAATGWGQATIYHRGQLRPSATKSRLQNITG